MKRISECDHEIPHSHTADHSMESRGRATENSQSQGIKTISSLFPMSAVYKLCRFSLFYKDLFLNYLLESKVTPMEIFPDSGSNSEFHYYRIDCHKK